MMRRFPGLRRLMRLDRGARGVQRAVDDELQFHFDMTVNELRSQGLDDDAAQREAERRFGNVTRTRERLETIDRARIGQQVRAEWWSAFAQDLRYALRGLRLRPGFAAAVIVTLGLGIGANATMFGIVDRLLFRPPRYMIAPDRTHRLYFATTVKGTERSRSNASYARFLDIARFNRGLDVVAAYSSWVLPVGTGSATREVDVGVVSASFWRLFDARPALGRFFDEADDDLSAPTQVVVLSYHFWQTEYGGDRDVLGKTTSVGKIVGVAPPGFIGAEAPAPALFVAMAPLMNAVFGGSASIWKSYETPVLGMYARRRSGSSIAAANADLTSAFRRSYEAQRAIEPSDNPPIDQLRPHVTAESILEQRGPSPSASTRVATWLLGVASIVLLIACANVGNLLLGRTLKRRREIAVRMAIGISRGRLASQMLIESSLLALSGGVVGLFVAQFGGPALRALLLPDLPPDNAVTDLRVLVFSGACAVAAGLLCGFAPVLQSRDVDVAAALKAGGRDGHETRSVARRALLVVQAGLSVVLLVGAGLFVRSMLNVRSFDMGYDAEHLLSLEVRLRDEKLDSVQRVALWKMLVDRARDLPSVANATAAITVPFRFTSSKPIFVRDDDGARRIDNTLLQIASPGYFATLGTRIIRGRGVDETDVGGGVNVAVVSEAFASRTWPTRDPIGQCIRVAADSMPCRRVIGIAADVHLVSRLASPPDPIVYLPAAQYATRGAALLVRTRSSAIQETERVRSELQRLMPGSSYLIATPIESNVSPVVRSWRLGATMFVVFGGLALVLAAIGLYSVVAYGVAQRTHEMGVRLALGARAADIVSLVVGDGLRIVIFGVALGLGASLLAGRWIAPLLFNVSSHDVVVLTVVTLTLIAVSVAASWIPASRAAYVDPSTALRNE